MSDREKLIELIEKWNKDEFALGYASYELADYFIANGVVIQKQGEWELKHIGHGHYWECSICHTNPCIYVTKDTQFCPNCGAFMRKGK